jgi:hypothetical protein
MGGSLAPVAWTAIVPAIVAAATQVVIIRCSVV